MRAKKIVILFTLIAIVITSTIGVFASPEGLDISNSSNSFRIQKHITEQKVNPRDFNSPLVQNCTGRSVVSNSNNISSNTMPLALQPSTRLADISLSKGQKFDLIREIAFDFVQQFYGVGKFTYNNAPEIACVSFYIAKAAIALSWENLLFPGWEHIGKPTYSASLNYVFKPLGIGMKNAATNCATSTFNCGMRMLESSLAFTFSSMLKGTCMLGYGTFYAGNKVAGLTWNYIARPTLNTTFNAGKNHVFYPMVNAATDCAVQVNNFMSLALTRGTIYAKHKMCDIIRNTAYDSFYAGQKVSNFVWHYGICHPVKQVSGFVDSTTAYGTKKVANFLGGIPTFNQGTIYSTKQVNSFITSNSNLTNYTSYSRNKIGCAMTESHKTDIFHNQKEASILTYKSLYNHMIIPSIDNNIEKLGNTKLRLAKAAVLEVVKSFMFY